jgi:DNA-directed RNA polymerase specialized sigma24 family protein
MNKHDDLNWRDVQLEPQQWANIPQSAGLWANDAPDDATELRLRTNEEIVLILKVLMVSALTPRQRQVLDLYFWEACSQVEVAAAMGISQAAVCQHLTGQIHGRTKVGGAFRKLRKAIHKKARRKRGPDSRYNQIIKTLDQLLDRSLTHRRARALLDALTYSALKESDQAG